MATKHEELTAIYRWEKHRWDETVIIECDPDANGQASLLDHDPIVIKTTAAVDELIAGLSYRFLGNWNYHPRHGRQFVARTFVKCQPHSRAGIVRYLMQAPWIGAAHANALFDRFGGDAVRIVRETPDIAADTITNGFTRERAAEASDYLIGEQALEACTIDLIDLLGGRGFPKDISKKCVQAWGNKAGWLVRRNPYLLQKFRGVGFLRCDAMYLDLGGNPAKLTRQARCVSWIVRSDQDGHTWHTIDAIVEGLRDKIAGADLRVVDAIKLAKRGRAIAIRRESPDQKPWIADWGKANNEVTIAERAAELLAETPHWPTLDDMDITPHQREQLVQTLAAPLACFTGSPGTGKTYTLARLVAAVIDEHGFGAVAVAAPTGKAAARISESLAGYGLAEVRARTIHSLLGVAAREEGEGWSFEHDEDSPLPFRYVFIDESSMIDCDLMASLLRAIPKGTHVLLVGDTNQLPPVGHGAPLRDLIAAGVPMGELREIIRNEGSIVRACHAIRDGKSFAVDEQLCMADGRNLKVIEAGPANAADKIIGMLRALKLKGLADPIWDCQVIVAVNEKSSLSRKELNKLLQAELNPAGQSGPNTTFRVGDKCICLKNGLLPVADGAGLDGSADADTGESNDGKVFVANGEIGRVTEIQEKIVIAEFSAPKRVIKIIGAPKADDGDGGGGGSSFDLAYAVTCHKMQGSECPVVFVVLDEYAGARRVTSRNWLYTGISRAKRVCFLVGRKATADSMCLRNALNKRKTFLRELLTERMPEHAVVS